MSQDLGRLLATSIAQLEQRLSAQIGGGFERVERKMGRMEMKIGRVEKKVDKIEQRMESMEDDMCQMEEYLLEKVEAVGAKMEKMEERIMGKLGVDKRGTSDKSSDEEKSVHGGDDEEEADGSIASGRLVFGSCKPRVKSWDEESGWSSGQFIYPDQEDTKTAKEPGVLPKEYHSISWKVGDEIIKKMQAERMSKSEEIPSFWNYDPHCLPKEFVGLAKKTFLVDPSALNICFLDKDILRRICKFLIPMDFLNLSYTCRYLHWRLFAFCTCYVPYCVYIKIRDQTVTYYEMLEEEDYQLYETAPNKIVYSLSLKEKYRQANPDLTREEGRRALVARIPSCIRKPFFFNNLDVSLHVLFFTKEDIDRCLALIMPVRKYVRKLRIQMYNRMGSSGKFFDYKAIDAFFQSLNITSYHHMRSETILKIFENCPYARLMDRVELHFRDSGSKYEDVVFLNRIGKYHDLPVSAIIATIKEFRYGPANLHYHEYELDDVGKQTAFLEYFFANYLEYEEYYQEYIVHRLGGGYSVSRRIRESRIVRFVTVMTEETGRKHMMRVSVEPIFDHLRTRVAFGTEKGFAAERRKTPQEDMETSRTGKNWWRMETAIEPEEEDKEETTAEGKSE